VRAAVCHEYGAPEAIRIEEIPSPSLGPGQVRVGVRAAAVNFPDVLVCAGTYQVKVETPLVPGSEFAGVVLEVADDVTAFAVGQRVAGSVIAGAFAEEIVVGTRALTAVPAGVDDTTAATFGVAHRTAYHVLRSTARVQPKDELVVLGAGGGVGLATVQLGSILGATVTAVASSREKLDAAQSMGAHRLIDHTERRLREALREELPEGADVVVDPVGGSLSEPALRAVHWGGRFVTVGFASGDIPRIPLNLVLLKGVIVLGFQFIDFATHRPEELARNERELDELLTTGRAFPHIGARFTLEEAAAAVKWVADGKAVGKVLLEVKAAPPG
jgi:NADPH2:quinone reductase